jgi:hypothetical protein
MRRSEGERIPLMFSRAPQRLAWGIRWGLAFAAVLGIWVAVMYPLGGAKAVNRIGVPFAALIVLYLVGGVAGGALVGVLLPIVRWGWGAIVVGVLAFVPFGYAVTGVLIGFAPWTVLHTLAVVAGPIVLGVPVGLAYRAMYLGDIRRAMEWYERKRAES